MSYKYHDIIQSMVRKVTNNTNKVFLEFVAAHASFIRFLFIGALNTVVDLLLYAIFANLLSFNPIISSILSTGITLCLSYLLNHYFVFKSNRRKRHTAMLFVVVTLTNVWIIQSAIIWLALNTLDSIYFFQEHIWTFNMFAKLCGVAVSSVLNYLGYRTIFRSKDGQ